tara:strand:- start:2940 stop:3086 length:147 start_codon:yes stop_codon:yes gene_type:complete
MIYKSMKERFEIIKRELGEDKGIEFLLEEIDRLYIVAKWWQSEAERLE